MTNEIPWYHCEDLGAEAADITAAAVLSREIEGLTAAGQAFYDSVAREACEIAAAGRTVDVVTD